MAASQAVDFLRQRDYIAVSLTHFFVDVLNGSRNVLVAILAVSIGLTNAQVGIALLVYNVGNALSQPLFGWLADRIGPRWLVIGGMGWMIFFFAITAVASNWVALIAVTIAGIGSGGFHPTGTMVASQVSHQHRNRATAVFFTAGQMGLFLGPIFTGLLLEQLNRPGFLVLPLLALIAFVSSWQWVANKNHVTNKRDHRHRDESAAATSLLALLQPSRRLRRAVLLGLIILSAGTVGIAAQSFAPKLFTELGREAGYVGTLTGLFMMGAAVGGIVGGVLADRVNGRSVILLGTLASILPIYFYIPAEGIWRFALLAMAGFFSGMPHSILIIMVQSLLPHRRALASGLALGFMFFSGSVGSFLLGIIADSIGLATALQGTAVLPLIAAAAAFLLPKRT